MQKQYDLVSFGEMLLRLAALRAEPLSSGNGLIKYAGGAELNVAAGVAALGLKTAAISRLPGNPLGQFVAGQAARLGVAREGILYDDAPGARIGVYYSQSGALPRKPTVVYDRANSSFTHITPQDLPEQLLADTRLFHTTGITLALGGSAREAAIVAIKRCKEQGALISFDVNYRAALWSEEEARETITQILPLVDILFVSEETSRRMFGKSGSLTEVQQSFCSEFHISTVFSTERRVISPAEHCFGSTVYDAKTGRSFNEPPYEHIQVVDRIGSGDAYVAGALFGLLRYGEPEAAMRFGNAMAAVKNTLAGDLPLTSYGEIKSVIDAHNATGVQSEMNR